MPEPTVSRFRFVDRLALVCECSAVLMVCAVAVAAVRFALLHMPFGAGFTVALAMPAGAALALIALGLSVPWLTATRRVAFPLTVTLPACFVALVIALVALTATSPTTIQVVPASLRPVLLWRRPDFLVPTAALQVLALSAVAQIAQVNARRSRTVT